ncbi:THAP-type domain-containing protein [Trichonephila clavipes]|uniref:THAP-type domain-containing protein n=1 Tax=Trichonephila clavipes TaxID=2585209 RepID=A0A8X6SXI0_TRICX|nr:THAP-type domain-containing protein [Trichonephila clavipes]
MSSPRKSKLGTMCSAVGCSMRSGTNLLSAIKMYRFPTNPSRRLQWEAALQRKNWKANPKSVLCNKHFITGKPSSDAEHPDYVPSIFASMKNKGSSSSVNRYNRQVKRREVWNAPLTEIENEPPVLKLDTKEVDCQTDLTFEEINEMEKKLHALETNFVNINIHKMRFLTMRKLLIFTPKFKMLLSSLRCCVCVCESGFIWVEASHKYIP